MQYPQIQFYRGSLVRLASGQLKQVEDLSSDDFLESAKLAQLTSSNQPQQRYAEPQGNISHPRFRPQSNLSFATTSSSLDENNNSVFNSPEPSQVSFFNSEPISPQTTQLLHNNHHQPTMMDDMMDTEEENQQQHYDGTTNGRLKREEEDEEDDDDEELDVVTSHDDDQPFNLCSRLSMEQEKQFNRMISSAGTAAAPTATQSSVPHHMTTYIDSSVVRDFLEVGATKTTTSNGGSGSTANSPTSSASSPTNLHLFPSTSTSGSISSYNHQLTGRALSSPPTSNSINNNSTSNLSHADQHQQTSQTVLIKFFLESTRRIVFIEVPIERPFFVYHRGWSSWNPQKTYDKFGLKCRKLKIGDTCISLIRRRQPSQRHENLNGIVSNSQQHDQQLLKDSHDQCNILFSSIKINE